jgi:hypothetical protein
MEKLKYQIHAETSITQVMLWVIILILTDNIYVDITGIIMIIANISNTIKNTNKL